MVFPADVRVVEVPHEDSLNKSVLLCEQLCFDSLCSQLQATSISHEAVAQGGHHHIHFMQGLTVLCPIPPQRTIVSFKFSNRSLLEQFPARLCKRFLQRLAPSGEDRSLGVQGHRGQLSHRCQLEY